ncbi:MAG: hypothetical protein IKI82_02070 [Lachnospiraceae bacterium]|nr:hypothetical protein [Lachnospiraceae bacterium]
MIIKVIMSFLAAAVFFAVPIVLTVAIETPIIIRGGITDNKPYIRSLNIVTNVLLNLVLAGILFWLRQVSDQGRIIKLAFVWFVLAELILIPVSEALLYRKISAAGTKKIFLFTYLANAVSCAAGLLLSLLIRVLL